MISNAAKKRKMTGQESREKHQGQKDWRVQGKENKGLRGKEEKGKGRR